MRASVYLSEQGDRLSACKQRAVQSHFSGRNGSQNVGKGFNFSLPLPNQMNQMRRIIIEGPV